MPEKTDESSLCTTHSTTLKRRQFFSVLSVGALGAAAAGNLLLTGCDDNGGPINPIPVVPAVTSLTITSAPAGAVPQTQQNVGTLPVGNGPAPTVTPTSTSLDSNHSTSVTITTPQAVNVLGVGTRGSNRYLTVSFANAGRQTTGPVTYILQITFDSFPQDTMFLDIVTQIGSQVSQAATVTIFPAGATGAVR